MERFYTGLDVSKDETAICIRSEYGRTMLAVKTATDPDAISSVLAGSGLNITCVVMETGRMSNWLYHELERRSIPIT